MGEQTSRQNHVPAFGLNGATTGERVPVTEDIRAAADAGYEYVELRDTKIERYLAMGGTLQSLRAGLREAGIAALSVNALEDATLRQGHRFDEAVRRCRILCEWAADLDCPYVVAVPSFTGQKENAGLDEHDVRRRSAAALRTMLDVAGTAGVRLGFEFLGSPTCSVSTLRAARGIIEDVSSPRLGLVIDAFHFYTGGSRLEDLDGLDPARIFVVHLDDAPPGDPAHLTDAQRLLPGEGVLPLRSLIGRLQADGYRGAYSLELFRPEYWARDPRDLARSGLESMRTLFESAPA